MRRHTLVLILTCVGVLAVGMLVWRPFGAQRRSDPASRAAALEIVIADVEAGRRTTPLICEAMAGGDRSMTFLAKRSGDLVPRVVSDVTGWGEHIDGTFDFAAGTMTRVGATDWYALEATVAPGARIEYLIAYALTDYRFDPHNPRQSLGPQYGGARASEFVMPDYRSPRAFADPPASPGGRLTETRMESRMLHGWWRVAVYTPVGYRADASYPLAVFRDGRSGPVSRVLDWLVAHDAIKPLVAVFVAPERLGDDLRGGAPMRAFLTDELLTWLSSRYPAVGGSAGRAIIGISFGAKDVLDAALSCADVRAGQLASREPASEPGCRNAPFDRLGLLIPGRRIARADVAAIGNRRNHHVRVAILAGRYDHANVPTARSLKQALADAGHAVDYIEVPEGHSSVTWMHHVGDLLVSLFGEASSNK